jgi:hypothetical protein
MMSALAGRRSAGMSVRVSDTKEASFNGSVIACGVGVLIVSPSSAMVGVETAGTTTGAVDTTVPVETAGGTFAAQPSAGPTTPKTARIKQTRFTDD